MTVATTSDVEARLGRALSTPETAQVTLWLGDVERAILRRIPTAVTQAGTDTAYHDTLVQVEADVVTRKVQNPDGFVSESSEGYSYSVASGTAASANLRLTTDEWAALGLVGSAWVLPPTLAPMPWEYESRQPWRYG